MKLPKQALAEALSQQGIATCDAWGNDYTVTALAEILTALSLHRVADRLSRARLTNEVMMHEMP